MDFTEMREFQDSLADSYGVRSTDCIVTRDHEIIYRYQTGHSDYAGTVPVSDRDFYYLYSCTKVITCTAVLQLIEKGKLRLYAPVYQYLPEYEVMRVANEYDARCAMLAGRQPGRDAACHYAKNQIRVIDLMAMMGGLTYEVTSEAIREAQERTNRKGSTRELIAAIATMPLVYEPGTRWLYSLAHDVLAALVEVVSGKKFSEYLHEFIFGPLGVEDDMVFSMTPEQEKRLSAIYTYDAMANRIVPCPRDESYKFTENYESGGAGLIGTAGGYSRVLDALACGGVGANGDRILKEETARMFSTSVTTGEALRDIQAQEGPEYGYGLGVRVKINEKNGRGPVGEFGWGGAAGAYVCVDPVHHLSTFFALHVMNFAFFGRELHPKIRDMAYKGAGI